MSDSGDESISEMVSGTSDILAPYTTALKMNNASLVTLITVYIDDASASAAVKTSLGDYLDTLFSYEDDTYTITTMDSIQETMDSMLSMMSALLGGIASISLIVGGIGIMNMMLTSVTERTVEIGLKKAIGAEPAQIQIQFLIEAFLLSMIGGLIGVALGIALSAVLCKVMGTTFTISYSAIVLGVGFSAAVGILFGWSPARKASNLSPIDALRRMMALGAQGVISVVSNLLPKTVADMAKGWLAGEHDAALQTQLRLMPLICALFAEVSPIPCNM